MQGLSLDQEYHSAYEWANFLWSGWSDISGSHSGLVDLYESSTPTTYWYLGNVAHLLEDMTVPAHVHGDPHLGDWILADDSDYQDLLAHMTAKLLVRLNENTQTQPLQDRGQYHPLV